MFHVGSGLPVAGEPQRPTVVLPLLCGSQDPSRASYIHFFHLWTHADPTTPLLDQARFERRGIYCRTCTLSWCEYARTYIQVIKLQDGATTSQARRLGLWL